MLSCKSIGWYCIITNIIFNFKECKCAVYLFQYENVLIKRGDLKTAEANIQTGLGDFDREYF